LLVWLVVGADVVLMCRNVWISGGVEWVTGSFTLVLTMILVCMSG